MKMEFRLESGEYSIEIINNAVEDILIRKAKKQENGLNLMIDIQKSI